MARSPRSPENHRLAAAGLTGLAVALLVGLLAADRAWGVWLFGLSAAALPVALIALALVGRARAQGSTRTLVAVLGLLFVLFEGAMAAVLASAGAAGPEAPWLFGLPLPTALLLFGLCLIPLPLAALVYAWTFDRLGVSPDAPGDAD